MSDEPNEAGSKAERLDPGEPLDKRRPKPETPAAQMFPVCPYCGTDPASVASIPFRLGVLTVLALFCAAPSCRKVLGLQIMGVQEPAKTASPIVLPGRDGRRN